MIGIIVDGVGDLHAIKARYEGRLKVLKADGPRGHTVGEQVLAQSAKKQVAMLRAMGCEKIAILTDFEGRIGPVDRFCQRAVEHARRQLGPEVMVLIADQMIENWLLADIAYLSSKKIYLRNVKTQRSYESSHGKREIKAVFKPGYDYNEVKHGAELFPLVRSAYAVKYSKSFADFVREIEA